MYEYLPTRELKNGQEAIAHAREIQNKRREFFTAPRAICPKPKNEPAKIIIPIPEPLPLAPYEPQKPLNFLAPPANMHPSIREIQNAVCDVTKTDLDDVLSARRTIRIVRPRQLAMALCKKLTLRSLPEIGRKFGGRDHTTVLHSVRRMAPVIAQVEQQLVSQASVYWWAETAWEIAKTAELADYGKSRTRP